MAKTPDTPDTSTHPAGHQLGAEPVEVEAEPVEFEAETPTLAARPEMREHTGFATVRAVDGRTVTVATFGDPAE